MKGTEAFQELNFQKNLAFEKISSFNLIFLHSSITVNFALDFWRTDPDTNSIWRFSLYLIEVFGRAPLGTGRCK